MALVLVSQPQTGNVWKKSAIFIELNQKPLTSIWSNEEKTSEKPHDHHTFNLRLKEKYGQPGIWIDWTWGWVVLERNGKENWIVTAVGSRSVSHGFRPLPWVCRYCILVLFILVGLPQHLNVCSGDGSKGSSNMIEEYYKH